MHILLALDSEMSGDSADDLIDRIFAPPFTLPQQSVSSRPGMLSGNADSDMRRFLKQIYQIP